MVQELERLRKEYEALISRKNEKCNKNNGVYVRYKYPVLTAEHAPLIWRYDFDEKTNPYMEAVSYTHLQSKRRYSFQRSS